MLAGGRGARPCRRQECGLPLIIGAELNCIDGLKLVALATDRASYGALSRLISGHAAPAPKAATRWRARISRRARWMLDHLAAAAGRVAAAGA
jgi:DNA polymerase III alpha subunit